MNMTADKRATAYVRLLNQGDIIEDKDGKWEVTIEPFINANDKVAISLRRWPRHGNERARKFEYLMDARVSIVRVR